MSVLKTIFSVCNKIMLTVLGKDVLKFDDESSYSYFINCKDNYKCTQSADVLMIGRVMEFIRLYVVDTYGKPLAMGFLE